MTLRNASGKFSLPSFGRKSHHSTNSDGSSSPSRVTSGSYPAGGGGGGGGGGGPTVSIHSSGYDGDSLSPGGAGGAGLGGIGNKIGKSIAHTRLLPALGNQDLRLLQDVISSEKGVLTSAERLAVDMQTAAARLPVYGQQEGPDLQDILSHSSTLLSQLSVAVRTFAQHEAAMRACFKRIREREEALDDLRRRRRGVGQKAESAERKLAKMGPENKQLGPQTELLESLRNQMRQMDGDIVNEEAKTGDFKRQAVKEAMSYKFGGLEELGEKMCIIGELGKLLLEEIPLEETPPGYSRAPYTSHDRTENTVSEAVKCLATVQFHMGSAAPKPPGLPNLQETGALRPPSLPRQQSQHSIHDHEEFEHLPGNPVSPPQNSAPQLPPVSDLAYAGVEHSPDPGHPRKFSAVSAEIIPPHDTNSNTNAVVWNAPHDADLDIPQYEFEQQRALDAEREAENERRASNASPNAPSIEAPPLSSSPSAQPAWQPMKATGSGGGTSLHDGPAPEPRGTTLHDGPVSLSDHTQSQSPGLVLNQDSFGSSFLNPDDLSPPVRPTSANSNLGYYTPDEERRPSTERALPQPPAINVAEEEVERIPVPEEATPTQRTADLPITGTTQPLRISQYRPRPSSGYIPPISPPNLGEKEEFSTPVNIERESHYSNPRISSSTFAVPRDVRSSTATFDTEDSIDNVRDSYMTYTSSAPSHPRDSYATFRTRYSDDEDAVVVTIPAEPPRTATPTMQNFAPAPPAVPSSNGHSTATGYNPPAPPPAPSAPAANPLPSIPSIPVAPAGASRISAAAFRRGARRRSMSTDEDGHSAAGHELGLQGRRDPPPGYSYEHEVEGDSLR